MCSEFINKFVTFNNVDWNSKGRGFSDVIHPMI